MARPSQPWLRTGGTPVLQHLIVRIPVSSLKRQQGAQARFVSLRLFVRCHGQRRGVEQVTQDSLFNLAAFPYKELEESQLQRAEVALPCYVGAVMPGPHGGEGQKKSV